MKIRNSFVSNSSSSSFVCCTSFNVDEVISRLHFLLNAYNYIINDNLTLWELVDIHSNEDGDIVITELYDNSLPNEIIEMIQTGFNATHYRE